MEELKENLEIVRATHPTLAKKTGTRQLVHRHKASYQPISSRKEPHRLASSQFDVLSNKSCCLEVCEGEILAELQMKDGCPQLGNK